MRRSLRRDKEEREREVVQKRERRLAKREIVICLQVNGLNMHHCE